MHAGCDLWTMGSVFGRIRAAGGCVGDAAVRAQLAVARAHGPAAEYVWAALT